MATSGAMTPESNLAPLYLIPGWILAALCIALCSARTYTRAFHARQMFNDDWLILFATILSVANMCVATAATSYGWGRPLMTVAPADVTKAFQCQFALQTIWVITLALIRISVAGSLLRFGSGWAWKGILYCLITCQILTSFGWLIVQFFQCRPLKSEWDFTIPAKDIHCWNTQKVVDYGWFSAAFYTTMDLILALLPIRLLRTLNRPLREKILIGCLMAMGLCATGLAGLKMTTFKHLGQGDLLRDTVRSSLYAKLEEQVGIIAACAPCLKAPVERALKHFGLLTHAGDTVRPSFVQSVRTGMSMQNVPAEERRSIVQEQRQEAEQAQYAHSAKSGSASSEERQPRQHRIDSVNPLQNTKSAQSDKKAWDAV